MKASIGLVELKDTPTGLFTVDEMLKSSGVTLIRTSPVCPGKYIIIVSGTVGDVANAVKTAQTVAQTHIVSTQVINNIHPAVLPALKGKTEVVAIKSIGCIETKSAITAVKAADIAATSAAIDILTLRIANGLGGKGFMVITGELSAVNAAIASCVRELGETAKIVSTCVIPAPHPDLRDALLK